MQVAQNLAQSVGVGSLGDVGLGIEHVALLQSQQSEVGVSLGLVLVYGESLVGPLLGFIVLAVGIGQTGQVVVGTCILGVQLGRLLVHLFGHVCVLIERGTVEHLLETQLRGVLLVLVHDLLVVAAHHLVVDNHAGTAQLRQDAVSQLAEGSRDVAYLLLALLGILIHRQDAQDDILVLYVRGSHQFLEAFPVLSRIAGVDGALSFGLLHLLVHVVGRHVLTLAGQFLVDVEATVGRGVGRYLHAVQDAALLILGYLVQQAYKLLHRVVLQLALTQRGLTDEELHVGLLLLSDDALEGILGQGRLSRCQRALIQFGGGHDTRSHLHIGHYHCLLAYPGIERQVEIALLHLGLILEVALHRIASTQQVRYGLVVAQHLLALERSFLAVDGLQALRGLVAQLRRHRHHGLLLHVLFGEHAVDGSADRAGFCLQRIRVNVKVFGRQRTEFRTR